MPKGVRRYNTQEERDEGHKFYVSLWQWKKRNGRYIDEDTYRRDIYRSGGYGHKYIKDGRTKQEAWNRITVVKNYTNNNGRIRLEFRPCKQRYCNKCDMWFGVDKMIAGSSRQINYICKGCHNKIVNEKQEAFAETNHPVDLAAARVAGRNGCCNAKRESWRMHVKEYGYKCALTGIPFRADDKRYQPSPDRIVPGVKGGKYTVDNIRWVLLMVNEMRRAHSDELFDEICRARVAKLDAEQPGSSTQHTEA